MPFKYTCSRQKGERARESWRESKSEKEGRIKQKKNTYIFLKVVKWV